MEGEYCKFCPWTSPLPSASLRSCFIVFLRHYADAFLWRCFLIVTFSCSYSLKRCYYNVFAAIKLVTFSRFYILMFLRMCVLTSLCFYVYVTFLCFSPTLYVMNFYVLISVSFYVIMFLRRYVLMSSTFLGAYVFIKLRYYALVFLRCNVLTLLCSYVFIFLRPSVRSCILRFLILMFLRPYILMFLRPSVFTSFWSYVLTSSRS